MLDIALTLTVDFNGIVLFDPKRLKDYFGGSIDPGTNIYRRFTSSEAGDDVVRQGIVVPVMGINDSNYEVFLRSGDVPSRAAPDIILSNGVFPFEVAERAVIADMAVLLEWAEDLGWQTVPLEPGTYGVIVHGFRVIADRQVVRFGYDFEIRAEPMLPPASCDLSKDMQVLTLA